MGQLTRLVNARRNFLAIVIVLQACRNTRVRTFPGTTFNTAFRDGRAENEKGAKGEKQRERERKAMDENPRDNGQLGIIPARISRVSHGGQRTTTRTIEADFRMRDDGCQKDPPELPLSCASIPFWPSRDRVQGYQLIGKFAFSVYDFRAPHFGNRDESPAITQIPVHNVRNLSPSWGGDMPLSRLEAEGRPSFSRPFLFCPLPTLRRDGPQRRALITPIPSSFRFSPSI